MYVGESFPRFIDKFSLTFEHRKEIPITVQATENLVKKFGHFESERRLYCSRINELEKQMQVYINNESTYKEKLRFHAELNVEFENLKFQVENQKSEISALHKQLVDAEFQKRRVQEELYLSKNLNKDMIDLPFTIHNEIKKVDWKELDFLDKECQLGVLDHHVWEKIHTIFPKIFPQLHNFLRNLVQTETEKNIALEKEMMVNFLCGWIVGMRDNGRNYIGKLFGTLLMSSGISPTTLQLLTRLRVTNCPTTVRENIHATWQNRVEEIIKEVKEKGPGTPTLTADNYQKWLKTKLQFEDSQSKMEHREQVVISVHPEAKEKIPVENIHKSSESSFKFETKDFETYFKEIQRLCTPFKVKWKTKHATSGEKFVIGELLEGNCSKAGIVLENLEITCEQFGIGEKFLVFFCGDQGVCKWIWQEQKLGKYKHIVVVPGLLHFVWNFEMGIMKTFGNFMLLNLAERLRMTRVNAKCSNYQDTNRFFRLVYFGLKAYFEEKNIDWAVYNEDDSELLKNLKACFSSLNLHIKLWNAISVGDVPDILEVMKQSLPLFDCSGKYQYRELITDFLIMYDTLSDLVKLLIKDALLVKTSHGVYEGRDNLCETANFHTKKRNYNYKLETVGCTMAGHTYNSMMLASFTSSFHEFVKTRKNPLVEQGCTKRELEVVQAIRQIFCGAHDLLLKEDLICFNFLAQGDYKSIATTPCEKILQSLLKIPSYVERRAIVFKYMMRNRLKEGSCFIIVDQDEEVAKAKESEEMEAITAPKFVEDIDEIDEVNDVEELKALVPKKDDISKILANKSLISKKNKRSTSTELDKFQKVTEKETIGVLTRAQRAKQ